MTDHRLHYEKNILEGTFRVRCSCGWWIEDAEDYDHGKAAEHLENSKEAAPKVVSLVSGGLSNKAEAAEYLTNLAARVGKGEIEGISVVFYDRENYAYERFGSWEDRWKIYGALEYAKAGIDKAD